MKVGIVGCGHICAQHIRAIRRVRAASIVGVCDRHFERAASVAKTHGVPHAYEHADRLIEEHSPDVIHVLTPPQSHRTVAVAALQAGCHVLVEKPLAMNAAEASEMVEASRALGRSLGVCHNFRFTPAFLKASEWIERGKLGRLLSADIFWRMSSYGMNQRGEAMEWIDALPGGPFQEILPHLVYLLGAVMGTLKLKSVVASGDENRASELRALFDSENGPATLGLSLAAKPVQKFLRVYGTEMSLHIDLATGILLRQRAARDSMVNRALLNLQNSAQIASQTAANALKVLTGQLHRGHETLIERFYAALKAGEPPPADGREGLATVIVLDELWRAAERNAVR
jgi:predicted dehydrogenase